MAIKNPLAQWTQPDRPVSLRIFFSIAAVVLALDQLTKYLAVQHLLPRLSQPDIRDQAIEIIPGLFALLYRENTGAAFSLFSEHTEILAIFSGIISLGFVLWAWRLRPAEQGMRIALGLIVGGAVGNLIDRSLHRYVIDFLHAHWQWTWHYPTFNIADSAVCVGMTLLVIATFRLPKEQPEAAVETAAGSVTNKTASPAKTELAPGK